MTDATPPTLTTGTPFDVLKTQINELAQVRQQKAVFESEYKGHKTEFDAAFGPLAAQGRALGKRAKAIEPEIKTLAMQIFTDDEDHVKRIANAVSIIELSNPAPVYESTLALEWAQKQERFDLMEYRFTMTRDMARKVFEFLSQDILNGEVAMVPRLNVPRYERELLAGETDGIPGEVQTHRANLDSKLDSFLLAESGADVLEALKDAPSPLAETPAKESEET